MILPVAIQGFDYTVHVADSGSRLAAEAWSKIIEREERREAPTVAPRRNIRGC